MPTVHDAALAGLSAAGAMWALRFAAARPRGPRELALRLAALAVIAAAMALLWTE